MNKRLFHAIVILICSIILFSCISTSSIKNYSPATSRFNKSEVLQPFTGQDVDIIYSQSNDIFCSIEILQMDLEERIWAFAKEMDCRYKVLKVQKSIPPYVAGNYPRVEIIFALK